MKSSRTGAANRSTLKLTMVVVAVILIALVAWCVYLFVRVAPNHAEESARPLESALVKAGAVKKCSVGDTGFGPDNKKPYYNVTFATNLNKDDAVKLAEQTASDEGYKLQQQQSPYDYIAWYSDSSSKQSSYSDLKSGPVSVGMNVYSGGDNLSCKDTKITYDKDHAAIVLSVGLPERK